MASYPKHYIVAGVDPGEVNLGICIFDASRHQAIDVTCLQLLRSRSELVYRPSNQLRAANLTQRFCELLHDESSVLRRLLDPVERIYIEDQSHARNPSQMSTQLMLVSHYGTEKCEVIKPHHIKQYFRKFFPRTEGLSESQQRRRHKKLAVEHALPLFQWSLKKKISKMKKRDDVCDAYWIARYGGESTMLSKFGKPAPQASFKDVPIISLLD